MRHPVDTKLQFMHAPMLIRSPGGCPKKGMNQEYKDLFAKFSLKFEVLKLRCLAFSGGAGGFRALREASRNHFHVSWYLIVPGITSYGPKPWGGICFTVHGTLGLFEELIKPHRVF